jgi:UDP-N-acetylglucosamine/UDP-N-acetylgalactosamine 4-epimerase
MKSIKNLTSSELYELLNNNSKTWVVSGAAGFIGSNIALTLLKNNQHVIGIDNFKTGRQVNIDKLKTFKSFKFIENDFSSEDEILNIIADSDFMLHQGAMGSVPRSLEQPILYNDLNVNTFLNILNCLKKTNIDGFVFASSSSVYGDNLKLPKVENEIGNPLSPYAVTKKINEIHSRLYADCFQQKSIGLRYFNVFGPRQDPNGNYAAVIPKWISAFMNNDDINVNGDGGISRDFCYITNVVEINIRSALILKEKNSNYNEIYNVACGQKTSLNELISILKEEFLARGLESNININYLPPRAGDIQDSLADITKAKKDLGYNPDTHFKNAICETISWYLDVDK